MHRVQRVPATEAQGRIHTSTATVAVLPEADEVDVQIDDKDLDIDIAASGGPGGQGVNTTNSAVQITHMPTGHDRQVPGRAHAAQEQGEGAEGPAQPPARPRAARSRTTPSATSAAAWSAGERSEKIRTYNFPQNRVTDHRIGLTLYKLDRIIDGDLDELIDARRRLAPGDASGMTQPDRSSFEAVAGRPRRAALRADPRAPGVSREIASSACSRIPTAPGAPPRGARARHHSPARIERRDRRAKWSASRCSTTARCCCATASPSSAFERTTALSALEAATLRYALHRAGEGPLDPEDRERVERALERLGERVELH